MVEISRRNPGECIEGRIVVESMSTGANGIRIKGSKVGLYKANGKALKTTGRDE